MLKKIVLAAAFASAAFISGPVAADDDECILYSGCFFVSGGDSSPGYWVCPEPPIYMDCVEP